VTVPSALEHDRQIALARRRGDDRRRRAARCAAGRLFRRAAVDGVRVGGEHEDGDRRQQQPAGGRSVSIRRWFGIGSVFRCGC
jgi:hypothetical protein